jgi:hypothetical protein
MKDHHISIENVLYHFLRFKILYYYVTLCYDTSILLCVF